MADTLVMVNVGSGIGAERLNGKVVNVYDSFAEAYAHGAAGLSTIYGATVNADTPSIAKGSAITQVAKTTGVTVGMDGWIKFYAAEATNYFLAIDDPIFENGKLIPVQTGL